MDKRTREDFLKKVLPHPPKNLKRFLDILGSETLPYMGGFVLSMKDNHLLCRWQQKALAKKSCGEGVPSPVGEGGPFARERWMRSNGLYRHLIRHPLRGCHLPPLGKAMMSYRICGGRASDASDRISCVFRCLPAIAPYRGRASLRLCRRS